ncbi:MAG: dethiobiotin synthase [Actinobacteria bacterium]|nr:dethiobiotin synthase [Actinomycetota bacterium]
MKTGSPASPEPVAPRGLFVTGTGTGVGKTVVAASILAALTAAGHHVAAFKPAVSGLGEPDARWPADHVLLGAATGWQTPERVAPYTFEPAVSPHLAAEMEGVSIEPAILEGSFTRLASECEAVVLEGVGGLLVPLTLNPELTVLDLAKHWSLPAVVTTHPNLGTISDTRLTVDRLHAEGVEVLGVVISGWPAEPSPVQISNHQTLTALCDVPVYTLPVATPGALADAAAAAGLPAEAWTGLSSGLAAST